MNVIDGIYYIVSPVGGKGWCIDLPSEMVSAHSADVQKYFPTGGYTQKWDIKADPERPGRYLIKWHYADHYLTIDHSDEDGKVLIFHDREDSAYQSWRIEDAGEGRVYLTNDGSGKSLDFWSADDHPRGKIRQKTNGGATEQKWVLQGAAA